MKINYEEEEEEQRDFVHEINIIAKTLNISPSRIRISGNHPCGEYCIFIDDVWNGYLDNSFYDWVVDGYDPYRYFEGWIEQYRDEK